MLRMMLNSKSSLRAQQQKMDNVSNNLSNVDTVGYKKSTVNFEDLVHETLKRKGYPVSDNKSEYDTVQNGTGVKTATPMRINTQGNLLQTDNKTDFAIDGNGYFEIKLVNGKTAYTRAGNFSVALGGNLVDSNGNSVVLVDQDGNDIDLDDTNLKLTNENIFVNEDGEIYARGEKYNQKVGKIKIRDFVGNNDLLAIGESLFVPKEGIEPLESKDYSIFQGFLEQSNVDYNEEMVNMIVTQRAFQLSSSALKTADEMWGMANNLRR